MKLNTQMKCVLSLGVSAIAISAIGPAAYAQENERKFETVVVTTQKQSESIQDVPIAVSAFDESALEKLQLSGGPDLVKSIPNVNFTKGNFTGYNFRIRGIGVDVVSTSGDAGVGVHINDAPVNNNRLFEAEFFDIERVETLRGPQGTLYGRNATGGVVNVITAKPVLEEFQANVKGTYGNYNTFKAKGMVNIPIGETAALRLAGSYLTRDGYVDNLTTGNDIDDRDLYSIRATLAWEPTDKLRGWLMYEHFEEDDTRLRSGKQYCAKDPFKTSYAGIPIGAADIIYTSVGCYDASITAPESLGGVNTAATLAGGYAILAGLANGDLNQNGIISDPRKIYSAIDPSYVADQDFWSLNIEYDLTDNLTVTYLGSSNETSSISQEDYNKFVPSESFNTAGVPFGNPALAPVYSLLFPGGVVSDPQLGQANTLFTFDLSGVVSEETTHELRLQSDFDGPFNFNVGVIKADYETNDLGSVPESYYVISNGLTAITQINNATGGAILGAPTTIDTTGDATGLPLSNLNGLGRNYYHSMTPYTLDSLAVFGEGYFDLRDDLTLTVGIRYTDDKKEVINVPTFLFVPDVVNPDPLSPHVVLDANGDPVDDDLGGDGTFNAQFKEVTGRVGFDWTPTFSFTDDTLIYAFYSKGYKGGGINPPQPADNPGAFGQFFDPEFVNAVELGTKNTLADGSVQLNVTGFHYSYKGYQITQIVNRTSANFNVDAKIKGLEVESIWSPVNNLQFNANLGLLDAQIKDTYGLDVLDRANGRSDIVVIKNGTSYSNCAVSASGYATLLGAIATGAVPAGGTGGICSGAFVGLESAFGLDGVTVSYTDSNGNTQTATAFQPFEGDAKDLDGNALPGTPDMTFSFGAEYTWEGLMGGAWNLRARGDYYYQAESFSRVWNTTRDQLDSWDNLNLSLQLANDDSGLTIEVFGKNVMNDDVITGAYLTDDSSGLFTNVFLNEPATYGVSVSKTW